MRAAVLLLLSILWLGLGFQAAVADVVGELGAKNPDNVSRKIEALYLNAIAGGVFPVKSVTVSDKETIQTILRNNSAFAGGYFPQSLNSLTCDLNPDLCRRSLRPADGSSVETNGPPKSTLQFAPSDGDWSRMKAGSQIVIPAFQITRLMNTVEVYKRPGQTIFELLRANEVCRQDYQTIPDCLNVVQWMNNFDGPVLSPAFGGVILVPSFEYTVDLSCTDLCAFSAPYVNAKGDTFIDPPFIVKSVKSEPNKSPDDQAAFPVDQRQVREVKEQISKVLPQSIREKIVNGDEIRKDRQWVLGSSLDEHQDLALATPVLTFDSAIAVSENVKNEQETIFTSIAFPKKVPDPVTLDVNTVLVIDVAFDESHCEFAGRDLVIYSCRPATLDEASCNVASPYQEASSPPRKRKLCGAEGIYELEPNSQTSAFSRPRHGTHIAGIIGANWDNFGVAGISERTRVIGVEIDLDKMLSSEPYGRWLASRVREIVSRNNVSTVVLAAGDDSGSAQRTWFYEFAKGYSRTITFVVSGGNKQTNVGDPCSIYPACHTQDLYNLISVVGLETNQMTTLPNSTFYPTFAIGAVGRDVPGPTPMNYYAAMSGSSQAAAVVAGAIAYATSIPDNGKWEPPQIRNRLVACSTMTKDLLPKLQGGGLDVQCLVEADADRIEINGEVIKGQNAKLLNSGLALPGLLKFDNEETGITEDLTFSRILGFQKVKDSNDIVVVFYGTSEIARKRRVERKVGTFANNDQQIRLGPMSYSLASIAKYVRAKE